MKISELISNLVTIKEYQGDIYVPYQTCYENIIKDDKLNIDFLKRFDFKDLFNYLCSELEIDENDIEKARICFEASKDHSNDVINNVRYFVSLLENPHINIKQKKFLVSYERV